MSVWWEIRPAAARGGVCRAADNVCKAVVCWGWVSCWAPRCQQSLSRRVRQVSTRFLSCRHERLQRCSLPSPAVCAGSAGSIYRHHASCRRSPASGTAVEGTIKNKTFLIDVHEVNDSFAAERLGCKLPAFFSVSLNKRYLALIMTYLWEHGGLWKRGLKKFGWLFPSEKKRGMSPITRWDSG